MGQNISSCCNPNKLPELIELRQILSINHRYSDIIKLDRDDLKLVYLYLCELPNAQEGARQITVVSDLYVIIGYNEGIFCLATYQDRSSGGYCPIQEVVLSELIDYDRELLEKFVPKNKESYGYCFPSIKALNDKIEELKREEELKAVAVGLVDNGLSIW